MKRCGEEGVTPVSLGTGGGVAALREPRGPVGQGRQAERGMHVEEGPDDLFSLLGLPGADGIDELAAGPDERSHALEELSLPVGVPENVALHGSPPDVGMAGQRSEPGAGRVEKNGIEEVSKRRLASVEKRIAPPKPSQVLPGLTRGIILCFPIKDPTEYAPVSLNFVISTK